MEGDESVFSLSKYRNIGVLAAKSEWVLLMDIDLYISTDKLEKLTTYFSYFPYENAFIVFPTIYLNNYIDSEEYEFDISCFMSDDIQTYAASSSTVALRRKFYLELGGQNENFKGWGFEDWEFASRLIANYDFFPPSNHMSHFDPEGYEHISSYYGLKGVLRTYADLTRVNGFYFYHRWHSAVTDFRKNNNVNNNRYLFQSVKSAYQKHGHQLPVKNNVEAKKALVFQKSPIVYNRQLLASFNIVGYIDAISEYSDIDYSDMEVLLSGVVLNNCEYQFFTSRSIDVIEPFFWGINGQVNWLVNRELPDRKPRSLEDVVENLSTESRAGLPQKPQCLIIFNPTDEDSQLLLEQRSLLFSLAFLHFDSYKFVWYEQDSHQNLNDNLVFIDNIRQLHEQVVQSAVVIHLNTSLLLKSLASNKPTVVLNNYLGIFKSITLNTLDNLDDFISDPKILDPNLSKQVINCVSRYSLYNINEKKYDSTYALQSQGFQFRYHSIFIGGNVDKHYTWSEKATVNRKVAAQYFNVLKASDFNRKYDWGNHDNNLENKILYNISSENPDKKSVFKAVVTTDLSITYRRYRKFKESPKRFFEDSRFSFLNRLGKFYK